MKIGILTQPLHNNYGGILQNYALQYQLKKLGHEVSTINLTPRVYKYSKLRLALSYAKRVLLKISGDKDMLFINPQRQVTFFNTPGIYQKRFVEKYINYLDIGGNLDADFEERHDFKAYIVGSDQVWRPAFSPCLKTFYLDFVKKESTKKIAYAASFGVDFWEADKGLTPKLSDYAKKFNAISVREESAIQVCSSYLNVNAIQTLDPTMLLNTQHYRKIVESAGEAADIGNNKICVYVLDMDRNIRAIINTISEFKQLQIFRIGSPKKKGFPSIESWINGFDKSDFVITDSFHGTVFAILFNKPFICIGNEGRGLSRFRSLLSMFGLTSRFVLKTEKIESIREKIESDIDFNTVNKILLQQRILSESFLINALNS